MLQHLLSVVSSDLINILAVVQSPSGTKNTGMIIIIAIVIIIILIISTILSGKK